MVTSFITGNWFSLTRVILALFIKFPLGDRRLFPLFGYTCKRKPVCSVGNTDSKDFLMKQDMAGPVMKLKQFLSKHEIERLLGYDRP